MLLIEVGFSGRVLGVKKVTTKIRQALELGTGVFIDALENNLEEKKKKKKLGEEEKKKKRKQFGGYRF